MTDTTAQTKPVKRLLLVADYGDGDLAFAEVIQKLYEQAREKHVKLHIDTVSVNGFDAAATGAYVRAAVAGGKYDVIYTNTAPRKDRKEARAANAGEPLVFLDHTNQHGHNTKIVGVLSGEGEKSAFAGLGTTEVQLIDCPDEGSQFRSRDVFIIPVIETLAHGAPKLKSETAQVIPSVQEDDAACKQKLPSAETLYDSDAGHLTLIAPAATAQDNFKSLIEGRQEHSAVDVLKLQFTSQRPKELEAAFVTGELAMNAKDSKNRSIIIQTQEGAIHPRFDVILNNGVEIKTDSLISLGYVKDAIDYGKSKSVNKESIPDIPKEPHVAYIDRFGNVKLSVSQGEAVAPFEEHIAEIKDRLFGPDDRPMQISIKADLNGHKHEAIIAKESFRVKDGDFTLSIGSSGWKISETMKKQFAELFLRGGSAAKDRFANPEIGQQVKFSEPYISVPPAASEPNTSVLHLESQQYLGDVSQKRAGGAGR